MNVVTYCRVSSEEQAQKDLSIPAQRKMLARWVDDHANYTLVEEFVDEGESAFAPAHKRPGFSSMIAYCKRNQVNAILVHKLDRFSRNREESILFKSLLRKHGVVVKSITENFDPDTPQGFLYEGMIEVINQFYSMNLATETIKGMRENAERARFNGGRVPYGYRVERVDDGKGRTYGRLVLGPEEEQAVVRLMFDLAVNHGLGGKSIMRELNRRQIPAPRGPYWNSSTVATLLDNPVYVGDQVWFKTKRVGRDGRERTDPVDRVITTNAHPAIVDRDLFERRAQLARGRSFGAPTRVEHYVEYLLSRLIKCGHCGGNFSGKRQTRLNRTTGEREPWYAYYCGNYIAKGAEVCASLPLHREWIEGIVVEAIRNRLVDDGAWGRIKGMVQSKIEARRRAYGQNPKAIEAKLAELDRRIQNYVRAIGMGVDPTTVQAQIDEANHMKAALEGEARIVARQDYYDRAIETNLAELERFRGAFANGWEQFPMRVRRQIVTRFIVSIEVVNRADLHIRFQVPFDDGGLKVLIDEMEASHTPIVVEGGEYSLLDGRGGAIPVLTDTRTQVLTTWIVSADIPAGGGERKPRAATLALRRFRRPVEVRPTAEASAEAASATSALERSARNPDSGHVKAAGGRSGSRIESRDPESSHGIESRRRDPWAARLKRVRATLAKARALSDWIACEPKRRPADAARREHVTRARVCQLLRLMKLAPEIWRDIEQPGRTGPVLGEKELRMLAGLGTKEQVQRYRALLGLDRQEEDEVGVDVRKHARHRGLAQHLAHARELQALVESGRFSSVRALARHVGLSGTRVSQLLSLLDLAPEILAAIEAAGEGELGITEKELRVIARMEERLQVREWRKMRA